MSVSMARFCPGAKVRAISRHARARRRYSAPLLLTGSETQIRAIQSSYIKRLDTLPKLDKRIAT
jgi:hypothetical protein